MCLVLLLIQQINQDPVINGGEPAYKYSCECGLYLNFGFKQMDNMASKQDIDDLLRRHKSRKCFQPHGYSGKTTENARDFLSSFNNYCKLNNIDDSEKVLSFEMCLSGTAKCWYLGLPKDTKNDFTQTLAEFEKNYLTNNQWLNITRLENRRMLTSESAETFIADMSNLALMVGASDDELSKALIRGLPDKLKWHVVSFNPTTLGDTIQRILLGEATISFGGSEQMNAVTDNTLVNAVNKLDQRLDRLEDLCKSNKTETQHDDSRPTCRTCGIIGHTSSVCYRNQPRRYNTFQHQRYNNYNNFGSPAAGRGSVFFNRGHNQNYRGGFNSTSYNGAGRGYNQNRGNFEYFQKNGQQPRV